MPCQKVCELMDLSECQAEALRMVSRRGNAPNHDSCFIIN